jgi:chemosensory pili system protein ChpC
VSSATHDLAPELPIELPEALRILLLPGADRELLIPAGAVAEIVRPEDLPRSPASGPDWLVARLGWRGLEVPLARLSPLTATSPGRVHAVVCFAPGGDARLPFIAIECAGLPRLERVGPVGLASDASESPASDFLGQAISLNGRPAWLVDLAALEQSLLALLD